MPKTALNNGCKFQVDLEYPKFLFEHHKDQPLAPEVIEITSSMLSEQVQEFFEKNNLKYSTQSRLAPNFYKKVKYVLHINNLKFYMEQGLVVDKIHRGVKFIQSEWLKSYVELNTQKRMQASSDFEKDFFKLLVSLNFLKNYMF